MTDKQIKDRVNVKECKYYCNGKCERYEEFVEADYANYSVKCICENENDLGTYDICDYQQLKRKEQECEELKTENSTYKSSIIANLDKSISKRYRELLEETGFQGKIISITKPGYSSPGLTGEAVTMVTMEIDGDYYSNNPPQAAPEECERIEVFRVKLDELEDFIASQEALNVGIDSKLYTFVLSRRIF